MHHAHRAQPRFWLALAAATASTASWVAASPAAPPSPDYDSPNEPLASYPPSPGGAGHAPLAVVRALSIPGGGALTAVQLKSDGEGGTFVAARARGRVNLGGATLVGDAAGDLVIARFDAEGQHLFSALFRGLGAGQQTPIGLSDDPRNPEWVRVLVETDEAIDFRPGGGCPVELPVSAGRRLVDLGVARQNGEYRGTESWPPLPGGGFTANDPSSDAGDGAEQILYGYTTGDVASLAPNFRLNATTLGASDLILARYRLPEPPATDEQPCIDLAAEATLLAAVRLGAGPSDANEWPPLVIGTQDILVGPEQITLRVSHSEGFSVGDARVSNNSGGQGRCITRFVVDRATLQELVLPVESSNCSNSTEEPGPPLGADPEQESALAQAEPNGTQALASRESAASEESRTPADAAAATALFTAPAAVSARRPGGPPPRPEPIDPENLDYVFGSAVGDITLTTRAGSTTLRQPEAQGDNGYLAAIDKRTGRLVWAWIFGGPGRQSVSTLQIGAQGELAIAGEFEQSVDLGGGSMPSAGGTDLFVARFSPDGRWLAQRRLGGAGDETLAGLVASPLDERLHLAGQTEAGFALDASLLAPGAFLVQLGEKECGTAQCEPCLAGGGYGADGYDADGLDRLGFDREGFGADGFDRLGFARDGFNAAGFDATGYDRRGLDADRLDRRGFGPGGFNRRGRDRKGFDRKGFNRLGVDRQGYDKEGFDGNGYDRQGYDRLGFNRLGVDRLGYSRAPFRPTGSAEPPSH